MIAEILDPDLPLRRLGDGAFVNDENSTLYWVDRRADLHAYHLLDKVHSSWRLSKEVCFAFLDISWWVLLTGFMTTTPKVARRRR